MRKIDKLEHAAKVVALCLVLISLIGLAALSRKRIVRCLSPGFFGAAAATSVGDK